MKLYAARVAAFEHGHERNDVVACGRSFFEHRAVIAVSEIYERRVARACKQAGFGAGLHASESVPTHVGNAHVALKSLYRAREYAQTRLARSFLARRKKNLQTEANPE